MTIVKNIVTTSSVSIIGAYYQMLTQRLNMNTQKFIPVLDKDISPGEINLQLRKLKANKAAGHDGLAPGVLKYLNDD